MLFIFIGGCSRVALTALEHVGTDYDAAMINLMKGGPTAQARRGLGKRTAAFRHVLGLFGLALLCAGEHSVDR
jgi:hypothetical protein